MDATTAGEVAELFANTPTSRSTSLSRRLDTESQVRRRVAPSAHEIIAMGLPLGNSPHRVKSPPKTLIFLVR